MPVTGSLLAICLRSFPPTIRQPRRHHASSPDPQQASTGAPFWDRAAQPQLGALATLYVCVTYPPRAWVGSGRGHSRRELIQTRRHAQKYITPFISGNSLPSPHLHTQADWTMAHGHARSGDLGGVRITCGSSSTRCDWALETPWEALAA